MSVCVCGELVGCLVYEVLFFVRNIKIFLLLIVSSFYDGWMSGEVCNFTPRIRRKGRCLILGIANPRTLFFFFSGIGSSVLWQVIHYIFSSQQKA